MNFGVAGYPPAFKNKFKSKRFKVFKWLKDLDLDTFEMQMTYGPRTKKKKCLKYKRLSKEFGIEITIHAAYYIVLTSKEKLKVKRSIETLKKTFDLASILGAKKVVLHPGSLYKEKPDKPLKRFIENVGKFFNEIGKTDIGIFPETAGKVAQLGSVDEILKISDEVDNCFPCIDFGHVHARTKGGLKKDSQIDKLFRKLNKAGAFNEKIHFHYTPVKYGQKGEITHKKIDDRIKKKQTTIGGNQDKMYYPRYERIIDNIIKYNLDTTIISETFNSQEIGAQRMKEYFNKNK